MVVGILVVEAVTIAGLMKFFLAGHAAPASATEALQSKEASDEDKIIETLVLDARMPNNKSGVTYIYDTEIYAQVRKRHASQVKAAIQQFQNEIKADITAIWRSAQPEQFQEPKLESLTRKVYALLETRFGADHEHNEPIISKVVIVMSTGFRIDS